MPAGRTLVSHRTARSSVIALGAAAAVALLAGAARAQSPGGIAGVVAPGVVPELVQEGFIFTEGPVGTPDGGLYFSDIRPNRIYHLDPGGKISLVREQTNGANGLALTREGDLLAAEGEGKRISRRSRDGRVTTVTEGIAGKPFLSPNDVLVDANGGIYITDPGPRSIARTASTSPPSPAFRCSTPPERISARSRCRVSPPMRDSPDRTSACFTSRRVKVSIASTCWRRDRTASANSRCGITASADPD